jgi:hypothetical protein
VLQAVLRQVADAESGGLDHGASVDLLEPGQHAQQRRLAGAIRAGQSDALAVGDLPGDRVEQHPVAEAFRQGYELDHAGR